MRSQAPIPDVVCSVAVAQTLHLSEGPGRWLVTAPARWRKAADRLRERFGHVAELMDGEGVKATARDGRSHEHGMR